MPNQQISPIIILLCLRIQDLLHNKSTMELAISAYISSKCHLLNEIICIL